ncbi:MAG: hypothetical protein JNJ59_21865 [Deltaproteobacteria bacterium]|nr:hypothetical protein [Deltaproteobacteria bacterium]
MLVTIMTLAALVATAPGGGSTPDAQDDLHGVFQLDDGMVLPYPLDNLFRGWVECTGRGHHKALDIGGVGPDGGLGSIVRAMGPGKVVDLGLPADDPTRFGTPLTGVDQVVRGRETLPAWKDVPGYGKVWFFTRDYGAHRSGGFIAIRISDGPLEGHEVRYLHIAAVRRGLKIGDTVEAGEELGLLGGTAVLDAPPHLHLDIETRDGTPLDVGRILGIGPTRVPCGADEGVTASIRQRYSKAARVLMGALRAERRRIRTASSEVTSCGTFELDGDFEGGELRAHRLIVPAEAKVPPPFTVTLTRTGGKGWDPRIMIDDAHGNGLFTGTLPTPAAKRRAAFASLASGRRGEAKVTVTPKKGESLALRLMAWPVNKRYLKEARWHVVVERPCP